MNSELNGFVMNDWYYSLDSENLTLNNLQHKTLWMLWTEDFRKPASGSEQLFQRPGHKILFTCISV